MEKILPNWDLIEIAVTISESLVRSLVCHRYDTSLHNIQFYSGCIYKILKSLKVLKLGSRSARLASLKARLGSPKSRLRGNTNIYVVTDVRGSAVFLSHFRISLH